MPKKILNLFFMKKFLFFFSIILISISGYAQSISLLIRTQNQERFWVYINNVLQNTNSVSLIQIQHFYPGTYDATVVIDKTGHPKISFPITIYNSTVFYNININQDFSGNVLISVSPCYVYPFLKAYTTSLKMQTQQQPVVSNTTPPSRNPVKPQDRTSTSTKTLYYCNSDTYNKIIHSITHETYDHRRLEIAKKSVNSNPMSVAQIMGIAKLFSYETNKLDFLKYAYSYCYEKDKYSQVNQVLEFSTHRDEINQHIQR